MGASQYAYFSATLPRLRTFLWLNVALNNANSVSLKSSKCCAGVSVFSCSSSSWSSVFSSTFISFFSVPSFSVSTVATPSSVRFCSSAEGAELSLRLLVLVLSSNLVSVIDSAVVVLGDFSLSSVLFVPFFGANQKLIDIVLLDKKVSMRIRREQANKKIKAKQSG